MNGKIVTAILFLTSALVNAGDKIDRTIDASANGEVEIHNNRGDIIVKGWDKNQVSVKGELDDLTKKFVFVQNEHRTIVKVILPKNNYSSKSGQGSDLRVFIPMNSNLIFNGIATDVEIENIQGGVDLNSVSGDLEVKNVNKRTYVNSVSGNIDLKDIDGSIEISTVSGDVKANVSARRIAISGVSSDLTVKTNGIQHAKISCVSGDAKLYGQLENDGEIKMNNVSGDSLFYVKGTLDARVVLETGPGGNIVNGYSKDKPSRSFIGSEKLKFTSEDGSGEVRMYTVSGKVGLKNSG